MVIRALFDMRYALWGATKGHRVEVEGICLGAKRA